MEIIFKISLPKEICNKIFYYTCKSPHQGLGIQTLKQFAYVENINEKLPIQDKEMIYFKSSKYSYVRNSRPIDIFKIGRFINLIKLIITSPVIGHSSGIIGDIEVLRFMPKLIDIYIKDSYIYGNIKTLEYLYDLQYLSLLSTDILGDIKYLSQLCRLKTINLYNTNIDGNITSIKKNKSLNYVFLYKTNINLINRLEFTEYRVNQNLPICSLII